ncbi:uncharacterized protein BDZ99DRAFT_558824, partial [Mytilinidion resinicola]
MKSFLMPHFSFAQIALLAIAPTFMAASPLKARQTDSTVSCPDSDGQTVNVGTSSFAITCDYDYYGNDFGVSWVSSFEECLATCDSTTGCVAVSYNGGACYPKSSIAGGETATGVWAAKKVISCPDSDGTTYTATDGTVFTIECSIDRYGNDLATTWESNLENCIEACEATSGCVDVSYIPGSPGPCYLKSTAGAAQANADVWGAVNKAALPSSTSSAVISTSTVSTSSTISVANPTSTPGACTGGFTTGPLSCPASDASCYIDSTGSVYLIECFIDRYDGDLAISWESSLESCISTCSATAGCIDVSYIPGTPGPCYMKSVVNDAQSNTAVLGAKLISSGSASPTSTSSTTSAEPITTSSSSSAEPTSISSSSTSSSAEPTASSTFSDSSSAEPTTTSETSSSSLAEPTTTSTPSNDSSAEPTTSSSSSSSSSAEPTISSTSSDSSSAEPATTAAASSTSSATPTPTPTPSPSCGLIEDAGFETPGTTPDWALLSSQLATSYTPFSIITASTQGFTAEDGAHAGFFVMHGKTDTATVGTTIQQLTAGVSYTVTFWVIRHPSATSIATIDGTTILTIPVQSGKNTQMWQYSFPFVAGGDTAIIAFKTSCPGIATACGLGLDAFSIAPTSGTCTN